jgi:hypothetical protein
VGVGEQDPEARISKKLNIAFGKRIADQKRSQANLRQN